MREKISVIHEKIAVILKDYGVELESIFFLIERFREFGSHTVPQRLWHSLDKLKPEFEKKWQAWKRTAHGTFHIYIGLA
jgi:hypothetical protein